MTTKIALVTGARPVSAKRLHWLLPKKSYNMSTKSAEDPRKRGNLNVRCAEGRRRSGKGSANVLRRQV
jgi:hypothetical protein